MTIIKVINHDLKKITTIAVTNHRKRQSLITLIIIILYIVLKFTIFQNYYHIHYNENILLSHSLIVKTIIS